MERTSIVVTVWPFNLLLEQQTYFVIILVLFTIAVLLGIVLVLLIAGIMDLLESAERSPDSFPHGGMYR